MNIFFFLILIVQIYPSISKSCISMCVCGGDSFVSTPKTYFSTTLCNSWVMSFTADFGLLQFCLKSLIVWLTVKWIILSTLKLLCSVLSTLVTVTLKYSFLRPHSQENKFHQKEGLGCNCFISYLWCIRHIYCQVLFIIQKKLR